MSSDSLKNFQEVRIAKFDELTNLQVYNIFKIRYNVFVLEQQSIYEEYDGHDQDASHLFVEYEGAIIAYARVYKKDEKTAVIGRVVVDKNFRKLGLGRKIIQQAVDFIRLMEGVETITTEAQVYLQKFYESFGFQVTSAPFNDGGVMHVNMQMNVQTLV